MFDKKDLECLDPRYFEIICMNDRDATIMSRNTGHVWYIHNPEYPLPGSCIIFHKYKNGILSQTSTLSLPSRSVMGSAVC